MRLSKTIPHLRKKTFRMPRDDNPVSACWEIGRELVRIWKMQA
jgi:hypothetical protein